MSDKTDYAKLFDEFWKDRERYERHNNPERTRRNIVRNLDSCNTIQDIDNYVCNARNGKEQLRKTIVRFYDYLKEKKNLQISSSLYDLEFPNTHIEELFEMARFLHEPRTLLEIDAHFNINERTRRDYLAELEEGVRFMGSTIKAEKSRKDGKDYYECTLQPIFLPLNLSQIFVLTKYIDSLVDENDPNAETIQNVMDRIKSQLTDYAFNQLFPGEKREECNNSNDYVPDNMMIKRSGTSPAFLMKTGKVFRFIYKGEEFKGRYRHDAEGFYIELSNGDRIDAKTTELEILNDSIDYPKRF